MKPCVCSLALLRAAVLIGLLASASAAPQEPTGGTIELPKYTVTTGRELPLPERWHYSRIDGFEILAGGSEASARRIVRDFQDFAYAIDLIWPGIRPASDNPAVLVLCAERAKFEQFLPAGTDHGIRTAVSYRSHSRAALVLDTETTLLGLPRTDRPGLELTAADNDAAPGGTIATSAYEQLHREYIRFLISTQSRQLPPWLAEGLSQLLMNVHITATEISIGRVEDPNQQAEAATGLVENAAPAAQPQDHDFNAALRHGRLLPMDELFATAPDATVTQLSRGLWAKQCYALVHWGLYGDFGRHQKEFLNFVHRLNQEAPSETLLKECLHLDYASLLQALRVHIESTRFKYAGVRAGSGEKIPWPAPPALREASQAETGRIQAIALTLAGRSSAARDQLLTAYLRGEREPQLIGDLGVSEANGGDPDKARRLLEAACTAKVTRPEAYVALARLRLAEAKAHPESAGGKISARQAAEVLEPLFSARALSPPLADTYELIATVWENCSLTPTTSHLAVLGEGIRLYPQDLSLILSAAGLQIRIGQFPTAASLLSHGLKVSRDPEWMRKFQQLRASLPPVSDSPPQR